MTSSVTNSVRAAALIVLGLAMVAMGIYFAYANDAPGGAIGGFLPMLAAVLLGVRTARHWLPIWARRTALTVGIRRLVRAAIVEQNLPGVSIAVGTSGEIVWAEGFGWRDIVTQTPVTPETRFNIGTASSVVNTAAAASLGMTSTGTDSAADWSPSHNGEPEDDFPLFTLVHDIILRPIGLAAPAQPLPGDRATFYVPRSDDNDPRRGRRLIYMRDLVCCAGRTAFSSTPSDLVRFALATKPDDIDGELAGGRVLSLLTRRDSGIVVAVASNITHADTAALAQSVANVFAEQQ